ncbi:hypothetical protein Leryth_010850 [Lithospermum erythrorhizon]|nr:hypothetical protein Leryth_010850 [Lithospermum erythrorhizon]
MAMQVSMGVSKIILIVGVGYSAVLAKNGKLSDVLGELQSLVKGYENKNENGDEAVAAQILRLAEEVRKMSARPITVLNGNFDGNFTNLVVPAATLGALGYGYMWCKGIKFSDLMYVTKGGMATAVSNLTKHLEHVSNALAATKRHLTRRIENLDGKLDEQVETSKLIRNEVTDVRGDISRIGYDLDELQRLVCGMDDKLLSLEGKQDLANAGVMYLCSIVHGKTVKVPDTIQEQAKIVGSLKPNLTGLKEIADHSSPDGNISVTDCISQKSVEKPSITPRMC